VIDWGMAREFARECLADYGIKVTGARVNVLAEAYMRSSGDDPKPALAELEMHPELMVDDPKQHDRIRRVARELQELLAHEW